MKTARPVKTKAATGPVTLPQNHRANVAELPEFVVRLVGRQKVRRLSSPIVLQHRHD